MSRAFAWCVQHVLESEGGLVDNAADPGGRTNLGITEATLTYARTRIPGLPRRVDDLTRAQSLEIYRVLYWAPVRGDQLPLGLALLTFDAAVNQGVGAAIRLLQAGLGVAVDGDFGQVTLAAALSAPRMAAIEELAARRMNAYMLLDQLDDTFGLGWSRRIVRTLVAAITAPVVLP